MQKNPKEACVFGATADNFFFLPFLTKYFSQFFFLLAQVLMNPSFMQSIRKYPQEVIFRKNH